MFGVFCLCHSADGGDFLCEDTRDDSLTLCGKSRGGGGVKALESDFTHVAMAADCNHPKHNHIVTSVCMLCTNNHNLAAQTHTNTHN